MSVDPNTSSPDLARVRDAMAAVEKRGPALALSGPEKKDLVIQTLTSSGVIEAGDAEKVGMAIDALVWAAKHQKAVRALASKACGCLPR